MSNATAAEAAMTTATTAMVITQRARLRGGVEAVETTGAAGATAAQPSSCS
jgi:hypothetical protein